MLGPIRRNLRPRSRRRAAAVLVVLAVALGACGLVSEERMGRYGGTGESALGDPSESDESATVEPDPDALNIVEIVADDMRYDDLRYAPNLRRLVASKGVSFRNAFSSYPLCCPARSSFFSGQETHNHGVFTTRPPYGYGAFDDSSTIATALEDRGYATGLVGKYLNGYGAAEPLALAREAEESGDDTPVPQSQYVVPDGWDEWRAALSGVHCKPACGGTYAYFNYAYTDNGTPTSAGRRTYSTSLIGDQSVELARQFHERRDETGEPFFLSINHIAPHNEDGRKHTRSFAYRDDRGVRSSMRAPGVPKRVLRMRAVRSIDRPLGVRRDWSGESDLSDKPGTFRKGYDDNRSVRRAQLGVARARAASVIVMDREIGRLIRQLKADGEWERTVLVFWSDNGFFQGEHGRLEGKVHPYEPVLRVPMLFTGPGMRDGSVRNDPMTVTDLTATLLDFAGAEPPHEPDGQSVVPVLKGRDRGWRSGVLTEAATAPVARGRVAAFDGDARTSVGVRTARYLYLRHRSGHREIYDLWRDPEQLRNLAANQRWVRRHRGTVEALQQAWSGLKDCAGEACDQALPRTLQVGAAANRRHTKAFYARIDRLYHR